MFKVLMTGASNIGKAGVATVVFRLGQAMEKDIVQVSYLAQRGVPDSKYKKMIEDRGGKLYTMASNQGNKIKRMLNIIKWVESVYKADNFDIVHINTDTAYLAAIYLWLAKRAGITKIVCHCHSTMVDENNRLVRGLKVLMHKICCGYVRKNSDLKLACSANAGKWLFKNDEVTVIPNGFDVDRFKYDEDKREKYRRELGIDGKFVICSVGRLAYQKNLLFTIDIYKEILKRENNSVLLFIGEGELRKEIENYVSDTGLSFEQVVLLGNRNDIPELLSASDVFLLPSRFEGLGIVYMEAQASGMPVFASDQVPDETFVTNLIHKINLTDSTEQWAMKIMEHRHDDRKEVREEIKKKKYDIHAAAMMLQKKYMELRGTD